MSVNTDKLHTVSSPGRIIMGDLTTKQTKDHQNRDLPENKHHFFFGVAIPKTDPNIGALLGQIQQHAYAAYQQVPAVAQQIQMGLNGKFAWKIDDGDNPSVKNEHARGCYLIKFSTALPIRACNAQNQQIDPSEIKRGYWVDVGMSISANGATDNTAGIYVNPNVVRLLGYAEEIQSGPSIDQVFANAPAQLPQGASANPVAPSGGMPGQNQGNMGMQGGGMPGQNQGNMGMQQQPDPNGNPATMQTQNAGQNAMGGMPGQNMNTGAGGMDNSTAYGGVNPHTGILNGPQNGMTGMGQ